MMARQKKLEVIPATDGAKGTEEVRYEKPAPKGPVKLVDPDNLDELISLLHNEAKVI